MNVAGAPILEAVCPDRSRHTLSGTDGALIFSPLTRGPRGRGRTTINKVANGPTSRERSHQTNPRRPLAWAKPALMRLSVPQPTAYPSPFMPAPYEPAATKLGRPAARRRSDPAVDGESGRYGGPVLTALIPQVFYKDMQVGMDLFADGIGMAVLHRDDGFAVLERDRAKVYVVEDAGHAALDRPELGIETDDIEAVYGDISRRRPDLLHPNLSRIQRQAWGAREFALLDATTVCVVFRDWS
jgi:hypothetical protein